MKKYTSELLSKLKFDGAGLIPAIAQDWKTSDVLMVAYMNRESLLETLRSGHVTYWSRSRNKLWKKGEESGNVQKLKEIRFDCDGDCLLVKIEQVGGAACHTGHRSCFFTSLSKDGKLKVHGKPIFDPHKVYNR